MRKFIGYLLFLILYLLMIEQIVFSLDVFYDAIYIVLILLFFVFVYSLHIKNITMQKITYVIWLLFLLFYRKSQSGINLDFYLFDWLKHMGSNRVIFVNIIGNIIIFILLGYYFRNIFLGLAMIVTLETLQYYTGRGMFDVVDIFLNMLGYIIGSLGVYIWMKRKTKKIKETKI